MSGERGCDDPWRRVLTRAARTRLTIVAGGGFDSFAAYAPLVAAIRSLGPCPSKRNSLRNPQRGI